MHDTSFLIRPERPDDVDAIRCLNDLAFGQPAEGAIVDRLRSAGACCLSLVAEDSSGVIAGHILFSPVVLEGEGQSWNLIGLGPMAVLPPLRKQGVGSRLVRSGLEALRERGTGAVVVLGHSEYYPRFGFVPASRRGIRWEHKCSDEVFMVLESSPGWLAGKAGVIRYRREFG